MRTFPAPAAACHEYRRYGENMTVLLGVARM